MDRRWDCDQVTLQVMLDRAGTKYELDEQGELTVVRVKATGEYGGAGHDTEFRFGWNGDLIGVVAY